MFLLILLPFVIYYVLELYLHYYETNAAIFQFVNDLQIGPEWLWQNITFLGDGVTAFTLLIFLSRKYPPILWYAFIIAVLNGILVQFFKHFAHLMRPAYYFGKENIHIIGETFMRHSFPSGHSLTAFSVAALLTWLLPKQFKYAFIGVASLVAWSRVVVGAHWPSDVILGGLMGWYCTFYAVKLANKTLTFAMSTKGKLFTQSMSFIVAIYLWNHTGGYPQAMLFAKVISSLAIIYLIGNIYTDHQAKQLMSLEKSEANIPEQAQNTY